MSRYIIIIDGAVSNAAVSDSAIDENWYLDDDCHFNIGDHVSDEELESLSE